MITTERAQATCVNHPPVWNPPFFYTFLAITRHSYPTLAIAAFPRRKTALYTVSVQLPGVWSGCRLRFCCFGYQNYNNEHNEWSTNERY